MTLTVKAIEDLVAGVAALADKDEETAHCKEDALLFTVLQAIASGEHEGAPAEIATAALAVLKLDYSRWYA